jgi:hypothetical protein
MFQGCRQPPAFLHGSVVVHRGGAEGAEMLQCVFRTMVSVSDPPSMRVRAACVIHDAHVSPLERVSPLARVLANTGRTCQHRRPDVTCVLE